MGCAFGFLATKRRVPSGTLLVVVDVALQSAGVGNSGQSADFVDDRLDTGGVVVDLAAGHAIAESGLGDNVKPNLEALGVDVNDGGAGISQSSAVSIESLGEQVEGVVGGGVRSGLNDFLLLRGQAVPPVETSPV